MYWIDPHLIAATVSPWATSSSEEFDVRPRGERFDEIVEVVGLSECRPLGAIRTLETPLLSRCGLPRTATKQVS